MKTNRFFLRWLGLASSLGLLLAGGCRTAATQPGGHKAAIRANEVANKRIITESPTLERAAPQPQP